MLDIKSPIPLTVSPKPVAIAIKLSPKVEVPSINP
jgi:hypothetical protein